ncbi:unnamed protein product [Owenia fusiformis]|uniref:Carbohydrate sulfotransferase n=1 Tax=Owenia fusiformis TaxID=6347 RepID=A0A8S4NQS0_OWEFU|nr:unnamed protein product [Owenia fusiformis]
MKLAKLKELSKLILIIIIIIIFGMCTDQLLLERFKHHNLNRPPSHVAVPSMNQRIDDLENIGSKYFTKPRNLQTICSKSNVALSANFTDNMLVDEKHKLLYCYVPKVGCTTWKQLFKTLSTGSRKRMTFYNRSQQEYILKSYYKFIFVREPFERLVSAYIDKFYTPNPKFWDSWGRQIIKQFRNNSNVTSNPCGHDVTFEEFLSYSFSSIKKSNISGGNEHWVTIQQLCNPCGVGYDYIGHLETMQQDTEVILQRANVSHLIAQHNSTMNKIRQNLHFDEKDLKRSGNCLDIKDALQRIIDSLIYKDFIPPNSPISDYTKSIIRSASNITDNGLRNSCIAKEFYSELDDILKLAWEKKLKPPTSLHESNRDHSLIKFQKYITKRQISRRYIKQLLEYFYLDFEAFGYDTSFYRNYM